MNIFYIFYHATEISTKNLYFYHDIKISEKKFYFLKTQTFDHSPLTWSTQKKRNFYPKKLLNLPEKTIFHTQRKKFLYFPEKGSYTCPPKNFPKRIISFNYWKKQ